MSAIRLAIIISLKNQSASDRRKCLVIRIITFMRLTALGRQICIECTRFRTRKTTHSEIYRRITTNQSPINLSGNCQFPALLLLLVDQVCTTIASRRFILTIIRGDSIGTTVMRRCDRLTRIYS